MRILGVRFRNLNSLAGEWQVDFTHPDYASNGIFAITGPTGAGKTTILDAVCLGLYGSTPRLGKVTKSANEIMSRQTGECFAEVTFETQKGRYRCHWSQRRARKHPEGELQQARHEIADADSGADGRDAISDGPKTAFEVAFDFGQREQGSHWWFLLVRQAVPRLEVVVSFGWDGGASALRSPIRRCRRL